MINAPWWEVFLAMLAAQLGWDMIKLLWVSYRTVMNRDHQGRWFPCKRHKPPLGIYK